MKMPLLFLFLLMTVLCCEAVDKKIGGIVLDSDRIPLPGVEVKLESFSAKEWMTTTSETGQFQFTVPPGRYTLTAKLDGFEPVQAEINTQKLKSRLEIILPPSTTVEESVIVSAEVPPLLQKQETVEKQELNEQVFDYAPVSSSRFQDALPLVPSVVRGPDGTIKISGARASESALLVNGSNGTDPVTGSFSTELPAEAVENVEVYTNPYTAEYGNFTGGVTAVSTKAGQADWKFEINDFMPRLHFTEGLKTKGVEAWVPRVRVSGPTFWKNLFFSQAVHYKFVRTFFEDLPEGRDLIELNAFDSLTQLDYEIDQYRHLTTTFSFFPETTKNVNLNTFWPLSTTPDLKQSGFNVALSYRWLHESGWILETTTGYKAFDISITPKADTDEPFQLTPEGFRGTYFNRQERDSYRFQWIQSLTFAPLEYRGSHLLKIGLQVARSGYSGRIQYNPVEVRTAEGRLVERVDFIGEGSTGQENTEFGLYVQDQWKGNNEWTFDLGLRMDMDSLSNEVNFAPRFAFSYAPSFLSKTAFKGGFGIFHDNVFLSALDFVDYPYRRVQIFNNGSLLKTEDLKHTVVSNIKVPASTTWNVEVNQEITPNLLLRTSFLMRRGWRQFRLSRIPEGILLSNDGRSHYREWEVTAQYRVNQESTVHFSYVRSRARGDTNDFETYLGNFPQPLFRDNEFAPLPFDAPNRFLAWGVIKLPAKIYLSPVLEVRNGFPYSIVNERQQYVGERNSGRFPVFAQLDCRITRTFRLWEKYNLLVGMKIFNVLNRFNPRDVQNNIDSPSFGGFYNDAGRIFRGTFEIQY